MRDCEESRGVSLVKKKRREERRRRLLLFNLDSSVKRPYRTIRLSYWAFLKLERPIELQKLERAKKKKKKRFFYLPSGVSPYPTPNWGN